MDMDPGLLRYKEMAAMTRAAALVCAHESEVDESQFPPLPADTDEIHLEAGGVATVRHETFAAFTAAFYAPVYGKACETPDIFRPGATIGTSLAIWNAVVAERYGRSASTHHFRRAYLEGGLWRVFMHPDIPGSAELREKMEEPGFGGLDRQPVILSLIETTRKAHFDRDDLPHAQSHADACRLANTVLDVGYRELGVRNEDDQEAFLRSNITAMRQAALLSSGEMNVASSVLVDPRRPHMLDRRFVTVDPETNTVTFDEQAVLGAIDANLEDGGQRVRRGCPVLYLRTPYGGAEVPIFNAMFDTIARMYRTTGALGRASIRRLA